MYIAARLIKANAMWRAHGLWVKGTKVCSECLSRQYGKNKNILLSNLKA